MAKKPKKPAERKRRTLTDKEKVELIFAIKDNDYNLSEVSRQTGVSTTTLKRIKTTFMDRIDKAWASNDVVKEVVNHKAEKQQQFTQQMTSIKEKILNYLDNEQLIRGLNPRDAAGILKILHEIEMDERIEDASSKRSAWDRFKKEKLSPKQINIQNNTYIQNNRDNE